MYENYTADRIVHSVHVFLCVKLRVGSKSMRTHSMAAEKAKDEHTWSHASVVLCTIYICGREREQVVLAAFQRCMRK